LSGDFQRPGPLPRRPRRSSDRRSLQSELVERAAYKASIGGRVFVAPCHCPPLDRTRITSAAMSLIPEACHAQCETCWLATEAHEGAHLWMSAITPSNRPQHDSGAPHRAISANIAFGSRACASSTAGTRTKHEIRISNGIPNASPNRSKRGQNARRSGRWCYGRPGRPGNHNHKDDCEGLPTAGRCSLVSRRMPCRG